MRKSTRKYDEQQVIRNIQKGGLAKEQSIAFLFDRHMHLVFEGIKKLNISKEMAQDAYTDALLEMGNQIASGRFQGKSKILTFLYSIFYNKCRERIRKEQRDRLEITEEMPDMPEFALNRLQALIQEEVVSDVHQWVSRLGEKCQQILKDTYYYAFSATEIAKRIGAKNAETVNSMKYRCIQKLKDIIKKNAISLD